MINSASQLTVFVVQGHISENIHNVLRFFCCRTEWNTQRGYYEILFKRDTTSYEQDEHLICSSHLHLNTKAQRESARPSFWSWQALSLIFTSCGLRLRLDLLKWPFSAVLPVLYPPPEEHDGLWTGLPASKLKQMPARCQLQVNLLSVRGEHSSRVLPIMLSSAERREKTERLKVKWKICVWRYFKPVRTGSGHSSPQNQMGMIE